jgi:hypothetical protein
MESQTGEVEGGIKRCIEAAGLLLLVVSFEMEEVDGELGETRGA